MICVYVRLSLRLKGWLVTFKKKATTKQLDFRCTHYYQSSYYKYIILSYLLGYRLRAKKGPAPPPP